MAGQKRGGGKKGPGGAKRRRTEPTNELDLNDVDSDDFYEEPLTHRMDDDVADIMLNKGRGRSDADAIDPRHAHKKEGGTDIDAGLGPTVDEEEAEAAQEEQRKRMAMLDDDDFLDDDVPVSSRRSKPKASSRSTKKDLDALSSFLANTAPGLAAEKVATDYGALTDEAKRAILEKDAPELQAMLHDFAEKLDTVQNTIAPVLEKVKSGELPTSKGVGFLEMKMHLFLTYLMHVSFYLLLKAEGKPIKGNPVVAKLVELRAYMDKLKPIEKKLQHQISRLLSRAAVRASGGAVVEAEKANLAALEEGGSEDEGETYVAPKKGASKLPKEEKKLREQMLLKVSAKAKAAQEEDMMGRLTTTRKQSRLLEHAKKNFTLEDGEDDEGEEGGGASGLNYMDDSLKGSLLDTGASLMSRVKDRRSTKIEAQQRAMAEEDEEESGDFGGFGEEDEEEEEGEEGEDEAQMREFMAEESQRVDREKKHKKRLANDKREKGGKAEEDLGHRAGEVVEGHRKISKEIVDNRGLVRLRPKKFKNPRVRSKHRADKLQKKVDRQVRPIVRPLKKNTVAVKKIRTDIVRSTPMS